MAIIYSYAKFVTNHAFFMSLNLIYEQREKTISTKYSAYMSLHTFEFIAYHNA